MGDFQDEKKKHAARNNPGEHLKPEELIAIF